MVILCFVLFCFYTYSSKDYSRRYTLVTLLSEVPRSLVIWSALHCDGYNSESMCV